MTLISNGEVLIPGGDTVIRGGDRVVAVTALNQEPEVRDVLHGAER